MGIFSWLEKLSSKPDQQVSATGSARTYCDAVAKSDAETGSVSHKNCGDAFLRQGKLDEAVTCFQRAISANPQDVDARINLGFVLSELKCYEAAELALRQALEIDQTLVDAFYILGAIAKAQGEAAGAIENFSHALELKPDFEIVYGDLCQLLFQSGQNERARAVILKGIALFPENADFHVCLGNLRAAENDRNQAIDCFQKALSIQPAHAPAYTNLGLAFQAEGKLDAAAESYNKAILIQPGHVETINNLGTVLQSQGRLDEAVLAYRKALDIGSDQVAVLVNLGLVLQEKGVLADAIEYFCKAISLQPECAEAHFNMGYALREQGELVASIDSYEKAILCRADYAEAFCNLGGVQQAIGSLDLAAESYMRAFEIKPGLRAAHSNLLYAFCFDANCSPEKYLAEARAYGCKVSSRADVSNSWPNEAAPSRNLRIGFVSGDFRQHPVGNFFEGVLAALASGSAGRLKLYAYASGGRHDEVTERIKAHCHGWYSATGVSDEVLSRRIRDDGIDILIDLSGHTEHNRLPMFASKPAPVQATWLGYLATTGVSAIDYVIADAWTLPESEEVNFTEKVWRLPESYLCFTPPVDCVEVGPLPAANNGYITFGSFNNLTKMNDDVVALWSRVLAEVPGSRLYLKSPQLKETSVQQSVAERFSVHGIAAGRLILEGHVSRADYQKPFQRVDIALDPFPYPGITTSVENLWMGVPVLTLAGQSFLSRQGVGLLMNAGLPEWIAETGDDYVARAVSHASDLQELASLRSGLRQRVLASPIFDAPRFAQHFETALRGMWRKWCGQQQGQAT